MLICWQYDRDRVISQKRAFLCEVGQQKMPPLYKDVFLYEQLINYYIFLLYIANIWQKNKPKNSKTSARLYCFFRICLCACVAYTSTRLHQSYANTTEWPQIHTVTHTVIYTIITTLNAICESSVKPEHQASHWIFIASTCFNRNAFTDTLSCVFMVMSFIAISVKKTNHRHKWCATICCIYVL